MSASKSKIKSATCTKCKQGFKFKRVPKMTSVVCPHCNATIRVKRSKSQSASTDSGQQDDQPLTQDPAQVKPARLPVPGLAVSQVEFPDMDELDVDESVVDIVDVPVIETRRTRERVSFDELYVDDTDETDLGEPSGDTPPAEDDSSPNIKVHHSRRKNDARKSKPARSLDSPKLEALSPIVPEPAFVTPEAESVSASENESIDQVEDGVDLLPPKFLVADIEEDESVVVLPTAAGGIQVVDKTEVTVSHGGKTVTLVALEPEELKRVRLIENLVALVIAGIMLAIALWLVL